MSAVPGADAFTPAVAVTGAGTLGVTYYDLSADSAATPALDTDRWLTWSPDGGRTWARRTRLTPASFDLRRAPDAGGFFVGDYTGLGTAGRRFVAAFSAVRGDPADVFTAQVRPTG